MTIRQGIETLVPPDLPLAGGVFHGAPERMAAAALIACLPAQNEAGRIDRCLAALDTELEPEDGVVLVANGCRDDTVPIALARMGRWSRPWLLFDCAWKGGRGSAPLARRLGFDIAHALAPSAALLSVDGDTVVLPGLRAAYAQEFALGFDLVCGRIGFLPEEAARLPPADPMSEATIRQYREASRHLAALVLPDPDNPWPHHGNIGGANFAVTGAAYRRAGPLPTPAFAEDRAFRRRCEALRLRIRYSQGPCVETSCRLDGRARGGLADELLRNRTEGDPVVDETLEPPAALLLRLRSRRRFGEARTQGERLELLRSLGLDVDAARRLASVGNGLAWAEAEDLSPKLTRCRMRLSDLRHHLPALLRMRDAIRDVPSGSPAFRESLGR